MPALAFEAPHTRPPALKISYQQLAYKEKKYD